MPWRIGLYERSRDGRLQRVGRFGLLLSILGRTQSDDEIDTAPDRPLDACVSFAAGIPISIALASMVPALLYWGYDSTSDIAANIVSLLFNLTWWLLRAGLLFSLPAILIYRILAAAPFLRVFVYTALAALLLGLIGYGLLLKYLASTERRVAAQEFSKREDAERALQAAEDNELQKLTARNVELNRQLAVQWRADVVAAGATAKPGVVPPMLKITVLRDRVQVMNLTDAPLYLGLSRVSRATDGHYVRCLLDAGNVANIGPHGSHRFVAFQTGNINPQACKDGELEFRVGSVNSPVLSWWTQSALDDFALFAPPPVSLADNSLETLRAQVADLERQVADTGRADRWRAALSAR